MAAYWIGYVSKGSVIVLWFVWEVCLSQVMIALENLLKTQPEFITDNEITFLSMDETVLFTSSNDKVCVAKFTFRMLLLIRVRFLYNSQYIQESFSCNFVFGYCLSAVSQFAFLPIKAGFRRWLTFKHKKKV